MKKKIISALLSGLAVIMAGCSSDIPGNAESPASSGDSILSLEIDKKEMTRSGLESTSFDEGDEVFVVVKDRTNPDVLTVTTKATYTDGRWRMEDKINLANGDWTIADIQVYYPYDLALEGYDRESGKINLSFSRQDILYGASYGWSKTNANARVSCKHAMTRITLALNNNTDADVTAERVKITNEGEQSFLGIKGSLDSNGVNVSSYADIITVYKGGYKIAAGATGYYDILLPPTLAAYDRMLDWFENEGIPKTVLKFELWVNDRTVNFDIDANAWEEGHQYTYPVKLKETGTLTKPDYNGHEFVDLGLSVKWATCNVGAHFPYEYGSYFAWGETTTKPKYTEENSKTINKNIDDFSGNPEYDAAAYNWGGNCRMPTRAECEELDNRCEWTWTTYGGKKGYKVSGPNGNSIFLPAAGARAGSTLYDAGMCCYYWSSSPYEEEINRAYYL